MDTYFIYAKGNSVLKAIASENLLGYERSILKLPISEKSGSPLH